MASYATVVTSLLLVACTCLFPTDSVTIPSSCCMSFISKKIPENRVVSYQLANGSICPKAGVIFITKKGHKFCTDPKLLWVQRHIRNLDAKKNQPSEGAKAVGTRFAAQRRHGNSTKVPHRLGEDKPGRIEEPSIKGPGQWTIKTFSLGPIFLLSVLLSVQLGTVPCGSDIAMSCCPYFSHQVILWHQVYSYKFTESTCTTDDVIFTTKTGKQFCAQPEAKWVQRYISLLNTRKHS